MYIEVSPIRVIVSALYRFSPVCPFLFPSSVFLQPSQRFAVASSFSTWYIQIGRANGRATLSCLERSWQLGSRSANISSFCRDSLCTGTAIDPLNGVFAIGYGRLDIYRHGRSTESVVSWKCESSHKARHVSAPGSFRQRRPIVDSPRIR